MSIEEHRDEDVDLGDEVRVRRRGGTALVAVRLSTDLLRRVQEYAGARGLTVSDVLRMGAEHVANEGMTTASAYTVRAIAGVSYATRRDEYTDPVGAAVAPVGAVAV